MQTRVKILFGAGSRANSHRMCVFHFRKIGGNFAWTNIHSVFLVLVEKRAYLGSLADNCLKDARCNVIVAQESISFAGK